MGNESFEHRRTDIGTFFPTFLNVITPDLKDGELFSGALAAFCPGDRFPFMGSCGMPDHQVEEVNFPERITLIPALL